MRSGASSMRTVSVFRLIRFSLHLGTLWINIQPNTECSLAVVNGINVVKGYIVKIVNSGMKKSAFDKSSRFCISRLRSLGRRMNIRQFRGGRKVHVQFTRYRRGEMPVYTLRFIVVRNEKRENI